MLARRAANPAVWTARARRDPTGRYVREASAARPGGRGAEGRTLADSEPDWSVVAVVGPPDGAPNILLILIDDAGSGSRRRSAARSAGRILPNWPSGACGTTRFARQKRLGVVPQDTVLKHRATTLSGRGTRCRRRSRAPWQC